MKKNNHRKQQTLDAMTIFDNKPGRINASNEAGIGNGKLKKHGNDQSSRESSRISEEHEQKEQERDRYQEQEQKEQDQNEHDQYQEAPPRVGDLTCVADDECGDDMTKPYLLFLGLLGVFHFRTDDWIVERSYRKENGLDLYLNYGDKSYSGYKRKGFIDNIKYMKAKGMSSTRVLRAAWWPFQTGYCLVVLLLMWTQFFVTFARYFYGFGNDSDTDHYMMAIDIVCFHVWMFLSACSASVLFYAGYSEACLQKFFLTWLKYTQYHDCKARKTMRKKSYIAIMMVLVFLAFQILYMIINIIQPPKSEDKVLATYTVHYIAQTWKFKKHDSNCSAVNASVKYIKDHPQIAFYNLLMHWFFSAGWLALPGFLFLFCNIIKNEFKQLKAKYDAEILNGQELAMEKITMVFDDLRRHYMEIVDLIDILNQILSFYTFINLLCNLTLACCLTFRFVKLIFGTEVYSPWAIVAIVTWFFAALSHMILVCISAGRVNDSACTVTDSVYRTSLKSGVSPDLVCKINVFLTQMSGSNIGLCAAGLFIVNRSSILHMFSSYLAYTIVLVTLK